MKQGLAFIAILCCSYALAQDYIYEGEIIKPQTFIQIPFFDAPKNASQMVSIIQGDTQKIEFFDDQSRIYKVIAFSKGKRSNLWNYTFEEGYRNFNHAPFDRPDNFWMKTDVEVKMNQWDKRDSVLEVISIYKNQKFSEKVYRGTQYRYDDEGHLVTKWHKYHSKTQYDYVYKGGKLFSVFVYNREGTYGNYYEIGYDEEGQIISLLNTYKNRDNTDVDSSSIELYGYTDGKLTSFSWERLGAGRKNDGEDKTSLTYHYNENGLVDSMHIEKGTYGHGISFAYEGDRMIEANCSFKRNEFFSGYSLYPAERYYYDGKFHQFKAKYIYNEQGDCVEEVRYVDGKQIHNKKRIITYY